MSFSYRHRFFSKIDGRNAISFLYGLDYKKTQSKDRIELINSLIGESITNETYISDSMKTFTDGRNWFEKYTDDFYKVALRSGSQGDALAHENSVFSILDRFGSYILWSEDNKRSEKEMQYVYKYYDDEEKFFNKVRKREKSLDGFGDTNRSSKSDFIDESIKTKDSVIHFLSQRGTNYKKQKDITITAEDLSREDYCGEVLREYNNLLTTIRNEVKQSDDYRHKRAIQALMPEIRGDMLTAKHQLQGIFDASNTLPDSTAIDWDAIDYYDKDTVKALIQFCKSGDMYDFQEDKQCVIYDFNSLIKRAKETGKISHNNTEVYRLFESGMTTEQIGDILGKSKQAVRININTICNAVVKQYEDDVEDWLYTYHRRGTYKTCNKCGETKLHTKFSKQLSNRDKLKTCCKKCENEQRKLRRKVA